MKTTLKGELRVINNHYNEYNSKKEKYNNMISTKKDIDMEFLNDFKYHIVICEESLKMNEWKSYLDFKSEDLEHTFSEVNSTILNIEHILINEKIEKVKDTLREYVGWPNDNLFPNIDKILLDSFISDINKVRKDVDKYEDVIDDYGCQIYELISKEGDK